MHRIPKNNYFHENKKTVMLYDIVAIHTLHKQHNSDENLSISAAQLVENQTGNLAILVRVQVEQNHFYRYNMPQHLPCMVPNITIVQGSVIPYTTRKIK